jgi:hypothetical protein
VLRVKASRPSLPVPALAATGSGPPPGGAPGALEGVVRLGGDSIAGPTRVANTTDPELCGGWQSLEDLIVADPTGGIANVIVAVAEVPQHLLLPPKLDTLLLDNRDCRFVPHAAALTVGSTIRAANSDPLLHTTHFYGALRGNISLPVEGLVVSRTVSRSGMIAVTCDVHGWMQAFIRVDPHDLHTVTGSSGSYRIDGIPAGTYRIEFWHERLGVTSRQVRVEPGRAARLDVAYTLRGDTAR